VPESASSNLFARIRAQSFPNIKLPFSSGPRSSSLRSSSLDPLADQTWSSESSSEGDLSVDDRRHAQRSPSLSEEEDFAGDFNGGVKENGQLGATSDEEDDDEGL